MTNYLPSNGKLILGATVLVAAGLAYLGLKNTVMKSDKVTKD